MKSLVIVALALTATVAEARPWQRDYPSCNVAQQHALKSGRGKAAMQGHIDMRANILQADIATASKARPMSERQSRTLYQQVDAVRQASNRLSKRQGFLSAAERASYDRRLDAVAATLCK